jgi:hypothetical protein
MAAIKEVELVVEEDYDPEYLKEAEAAGFSLAQAKFLMDTFALDPHQHDAEDIIMGGDETLADFAESFSEAD